MAKRRKALRRFVTAGLVARGVLAVLLAVALGAIGYQGLRFARSCFTLEGARVAIETHVKGKYVRRIARVMKAADRELLMASTSVQVTALSCGPSLLGGMTCRARFVVNGQSARSDATDHYFRIGFSLLAGWQPASVIETSGLRYSLAPCRCSWEVDGR